MSYTLEYIKEAILPTRRRFDLSSWRLFWEETIKWIQQQSSEDNRKLDFSIDHLNSVSSYDAGLLIDYFFDYLHDVYGIKPVWKQVLPPVKSSHHPILDRESNHPST